VQEQVYSQADFSEEEGGLAVIGVFLGHKNNDKYCRIGSRRFVVQKAYVLIITLYNKYFN